MQAGEGDELPAVAQFAEAGDVGFLFVGGHGGFPVEGGREVVGESVKIESVSYVLLRRDSGKYFCSGQVACTPLANSSACA